MANYTRNNETINGSSGSTDYHQGTSAADSISITNVTIASGEPVTVNDYWEPYTVNGGALIYDGEDGNDTLTARNVKIEDGMFQLIGGNQNDKLTATNITQNGGRFGLNGGWQSDSISASNITITGGTATISGDSDDKDTVSVSKVSITGGKLDERSDGKQNILTASEVTIQGGQFVERTTTYERVGDDKFDSLAVVPSLGGSNTLSANKISMTGGSLAVYSEGENNSIKVSDVTMSGSSAASIYGGKTANINGGKGTDTISVSKVSMGSYYASLSVFNGGSNNAISVEDVTISSGYASIYGEGGNNTITANKLLTEMYSHLDIHAQEKANSIAITNSTFNGGYGASIYGEGGNDTFSFTNNTVTSNEIKIWGGSSEDKFTVEDITISGGTVSINGKGGADNFTVDDVSMTGGNIYLIGGNGNANVSVSNIDKTAGYFDIDMGGHDSVTSGNDTIYVENISNAYRAYFDIYARGGADSISIKNSTNNGYLRAYGGAGNDSIFAENISVEGSYGYFSIVGGADDDLISLKAVTKSYAYGEDGNDTIIASESHIGIDAGAGNDSVSVTKIIENSAANFDCGEGNDTIEFYETWMPNYDSYTGTGGRVSGDAGNDLLIARNATINGTAFYGGEGNDTISVHDSTLTSGARFYNGAGNDSVSVSNITGNFSGDAMFYSEYSTYASDGNDTISLDNWTLTGDDSQRIFINGNFFTTDNSSINGADSISIKNIIAPNATFYVYGKGGNDTVSFENMTLGGLGTSYGSTMVRNGNIYGNFDSGNDSISVSGIEFYKGSSSYVSLNGGAGADTISVDDVKLGSEDDTRNTYSRLSITGGEGADVINVSNVSITGSESDGYILGDAGADKISVTDSDGLQITGGDGNDTLTFGGAVNATLTDLAAGDVVSLSGDYQKAYYKDGVFIYGTGVKVSLSGVDDVADISNVTIYNGSTRTNFGSFVTVLEWKLEDGVASYGDLLTVSGLSANASFEDITVDGKAINTMDDEEIKASGKPVVISANALDTSKTVSITSGYTLALNSNVTDVPKDVAQHWEVSEGNAAYFAVGKSAGYVLEDNTIFYKSEQKGDTLTSISGLNTNATTSDISLSNKVVTIRNNALDTSKTVKITGDGYTLALASNVTKPSTRSNYWTISNGTADYMTGATTAGYVINDNQISYQAENAGTAQIEITGLSSSATLSNISLSGTKVTISAGALDTSNTVKITDGYTLALASGVETPTVKSPYWTISNGTANYIGEVTAGYVVSDNQISYHTAGVDTVISITGLSSSATLNDISLDSNGVVTISKGALDTSKTVKITGSGYTLALGSDVETSKDISSHWEISEGNAAYLSDGSTSGFATDGSSIYYQSAISGAAVVELSGLSDSATENDLSLGSNGIVTISAGALDENKTVEIVGGSSYKLALGSDVKVGSITDGGWSISGGNASYNIAGSTEGYILSGNKITHVSELESGTLVSLSGLNSSVTEQNLSINTETQIVTIEQAATTKGTLKISDGYTLELEQGTYSEVSVVGGENSNSIIQNGNGAVISVGAGDDSISLASGVSKNTIIGGKGNDSVSATQGNNLYQYEEGDGDDFISGFTDKDSIKFTSGNVESWTVSDKDLTLKIGDGSIKIAEGAGASIHVIESDSTKAVTYIYEDGLKYNYKKTSVTLAADYKENYTPVSTVVSIDGAATNSVQITGNTRNNLIIGGAGADTLNGNTGNDTLTGGDGNDIFIYEGGNDVITDYTEGDKISIGASITGVSVKSADVILKFGSKKLTAKNAAGKKVTVNDEVFIYETGKIFNEDKTAVTLTSALKGTIDSGIKSVDGSTIKTSMNITGNDENNLIYGGKTADTLNGGNGNDTLYGDTGYDTFIYTGGDDVIADYAAGDKISLNAEISGFSVEDNDVIFKTADGTITVKNGAGVKITTISLVNSQKTTLTQIYKDGLAYNAYQTSVTLNSDYSGSYTESFKNIVTINGAAANSIKITGNDKNNLISGNGTISGGNGGDTINGGENADSIFGDAGNDKLFGNAGDDTLNGGLGYDTLTGGEGKDVFIYEGGNDVITDYAEEDKISVGNSTISSVLISGNDVILKIEKNTLRIKEGVGKKITVNDETKIYEKGKIYDGEKLSVTLNAAVTATLESSVVNVDGSTSAGALKVVVNDLDNSILGGKSSDSILGGGGNDTIFGNAGSDKLYGEEGNDILDGGAGNDTLAGGEGNDTLTGGDGYDVFIFESGNDVITDYAAGRDKIKFTEEIKNYSISGENVLLETDNGTLTIQDGVGKEITIINSNNKITRQTYSDANARTLELFDSSNFLNDVVNLDSIMAKKFEMQNIETEIYNTLVQDSKILTFAKEK